MREQSGGTMRRWTLPAALLLGLGFYGAFQVDVAKRGARTAPRHGGAPAGAGEERAEAPVLQAAAPGRDGAAAGDPEPAAAGGTAERGEGAAGAVVEWAALRECFPSLSEGGPGGSLFLSHVPKAGGTSLNAILARAALGRGEQFDAVGRALYDPRRRREASRRSLWSSELPYRNFARTVRGGGSSRFVRVVMLRETRSRYESYHSMRAATPKAHTDDYRDPAKTRELVRKHANVQVEHVCPAANGCVPGGGALDGWAVLMFEDFHNGALLLCAFMGIPAGECCVPSINRRPAGMGQRFTLPESELGAFWDANKADAALYAEGRRRYEAAKACAAPLLERYKAAGAGAVCLEGSNEGLPGVKINTAYAGRAPLVGKRRKEG